MSDSDSNNDFQYINDSPEIPVFRTQGSVRSLTDRNVSELNPTLGTSDLMASPSASASKRNITLPDSAIGSSYQRPAAAKTHPIDDIHQFYELAPDSWDSNRDLSSGEVNISSDEFPGGVAGPLWSRLTHRGMDSKQRKTLRDLKKLQQKGFDIQFGKDAGTGHSGAFVYFGVYTHGISTLTDRERRYLGDDIQVGITRFAAKYVQFGSKSSVNNRISYELEKNIMKRLIGHPFVISYKIAINLGRKCKVVRQMQDLTNHFPSYDRMFLIMDFCDQGPLFDLLDARPPKLYDLQAVRLIECICLGLQYMHSKSVAHGDVHARNILLSTDPQNPNLMVAKWMDFGRSVALDHWSTHNVDESRVRSLQRQDIVLMLLQFKRMLSIIERTRHLNQGVNMHSIKQLCEALDVDGQTLNNVLRDDTFVIHYNH